MFQPGWLQSLVVRAALRSRSTDNGLQQDRHIKTDIKMGETGTAMNKRQQKQVISFYLTVFVLILGIFAYAAHVSFGPPETVVIVPTDIPADNVMDNALDITEPVSVQEPTPMPVLMRDENITQCRRPLGGAPNVGVLYDGAAEYETIRQQVDSNPGAYQLACDDGNGGARLIDFTGNSQLRLDDVMVQRTQG